MDRDLLEICSLADALQRHSMNGQSAVCDKRVWRPQDEEEELEKHWDGSHTIREDQGDGHRIDTPHGFIQYRPTQHANEVWWIESHKRNHGRELMRLMLEHHPHTAVAWGATSEAGQAFRERWHAKNPHVADAEGGERIPFEGQFDPFDHGEDDVEDDDWFDDDEESLDRHMGVVGDWSLGGPPNGERKQFTSADFAADPSVRKFKGNLYRGARMKELPEIGSVHSWQSLRSASKDPDVPFDDDFVSATAPWHSTYWEIENGAGHDIADHPEHEYPHQQEVVMPEDARLWVRGIRWRGKGAPGSGDGHWHIRARQLEPDEYKDTEARRLYVALDAIARIDVGGT